jgi:hypothetical protein
MSSPPPPHGRVEVDRYGVRREFYVGRIDRCFAVLENPNL